MDRFEIWFGGLFVALGLIALVAFAVLFLVLKRIPRVRPARWAFLGAPLGIGVIFTRLGGGFAGYGLWELRTEQHLVANGTTTRATVTGVEQTSTRINGRYLWRVRYELQDQNGRTQRGSSRLLDREEAQAFRPGEQVFVRYDPTQPATSIWLGRDDLAE